MGGGRRRELEERRHWIEVDRSEEDIDLGKSEIVVVAELKEVAVSVGVTGSGGNESHYWWGRDRWSVALVDMPSGQYPKVGTRQ